MSTPDPEDAAQLRRNKMIGRAVIIGFGLLLAVYLVPLFWGLFTS